MRPALVLTTMPPYNGLLICGVSSKIRQEVKGFDEVVSTADPDFGSSGLKVSSIVRLGMVTTIPKDAVLGELVTLSSDRLSAFQPSLLHFCRSVS